MIENTKKQWDYLLPYRFHCDVVDVFNKSAAFMHCDVISFREYWSIRNPKTTVWWSGKSDQIREIYCIRTRNFDGYMINNNLIWKTAPCSCFLRQAKGTRNLSNRGLKIVISYMEKLFIWSSLLFKTSYCIF
jgi:hypothetical protein